MPEPAPDWICELWRTVGKPPEKFRPGPSRPGPSHAEREEETPPEPKGSAAWPRSCVNTHLLGTGLLLGSADEELKFKAHLEQQKASKASAKRAKFYRGKAVALPVAEEDY
jgi:hypothetical protein